MKSSQADAFSSHHEGLSLLTMRVCNQAACQGATLWGSCGILQSVFWALYPCFERELKRKGGCGGSGHSAYCHYPETGLGWRRSHGIWERLLQDFMSTHGFNSISDFQGASLEYFTTHMELVRMQREAIVAKRAKKVGLSKDDEWSGDGFVAESESMVSNRWLYGKQIAVHRQFRFYLIHGICDGLCALSTGIWSRLVAVSLMFSCWNEVLCLCFIFSSAIFSKLRDSKVCLGI